MGNKEKVFLVLLVVLLIWNMISIWNIDIAVGCINKNSDLLYESHFMTNGFFNWNCMEAYHVWLYVNLGTIFLLGVLYVVK